MESETRARSWENQNLRTGELGSMVLQWQGPRIKTLRGGGSFRCCLSKASCSSLFPQISLAKRLALKHKSKGEKCCKSKALQTLKVKTLGVELTRPRTSSFFNLCSKANSEKG
jgi:hypothetical protein